MYSVKRRDCAWGPGTTSKQQKSTRGCSLTQTTHHHVDRVAGQCEVVCVATPAPLTYRDLLTMARDRLGSGAASLKTREELLRALGLEANTPVPMAAPSEMVLVTSDFFVERSKPSAKK